MRQIPARSLSLANQPGGQPQLLAALRIGGDSVEFQAKKPNWSIPADAQLPVVVQIGLDTPWNLQGAGNGQVVEWSLDRIAVQTFDAQFRRAGSMTVSFPSGNEPPWTVGLNGSTAISNAFGRCVTDMSARASANSPRRCRRVRRSPTVSRRASRSRRNRRSRSHHDRRGDTMTTGRCLCGAIRYEY